MTFPRAIREAIPESNDGRILVLDSMSARAVNTRWTGPRVDSHFTLKETGKLDGEFVVLMNLEVEAVRALAATLLRLADEAEKLEPATWEYSM